MRNDATLDSMDYGDVTFIRVAPTSIVTMREDVVVEIQDFPNVAECNDRWGAMAVAICQVTT